MDNLLFTCSYMWKEDEVGFRDEEKTPPFTRVEIWNYRTSPLQFFCHVTVLSSPDCFEPCTFYRWRLSDSAEIFKNKIITFPVYDSFKLGQRKVKWTFKLDLHVCPFMKEKKPDSRFRTLAGKRQTSLFEFLPSLLGINSPLLLLSSLGTWGWRVHKASGQGWV